MKSIGYHRQASTMLPWDVEAAPGPRHENSPPRATRSTMRRRPDPMIDGYRFLPEVKDGCEVSPSCFTCSLPMCKFDDPAWYKRYRSLERARAACKLRDQGIAIPEIATLIGKGRRTVHRLIRMIRQEGVDIA